MSKLTMIGMSNYDPTLFDNLTFPTGIDKDLAVDTILLRSAEFEVIYPQPDFLKFAIGAWGRRHYRTFEKWVNVLSKEYEPLWNYDRTEETRDELRKTFGSTTSADYDENRTLNLQDQRTADLTTERTDDLQDKRTADLTTERTDDLQDKRTADLTTERTDDLTDERTADLTDERTADLQDKTTHNTTVTTTQTADGTTQHDVAAYDSSTLAPSWKDTVNTGANTVVTTGDETVDTTGTDTMTHTGTDTMTHTGTATTTETGTDTMDHTGTATTTETGTDTMDHTGTATTTETGTDTMNRTGTDKLNTKGTMSDVEGNEANTNIHTAKMFGNIGIMSSQDLLQQEITVQRFDLYAEIANLFIDDFCILVYV